MVARPGQHRGKVEVMLVNFTPWSMTLLFSAGILFSVPGHWSSVRTKTMLGRFRAWADTPCTPLFAPPSPTQASVNASVAAKASTTRLNLPVDTSLMFCLLKRETAEDNSPYAGYRATNVAQGTARR